MQKTIAFSKIEVSKKSAIASRAIYSVIILCFTTLFLITTWFLEIKWDEDISESLKIKKIFSIFQILLLSPFIFISYREILNFAKVKKYSIKTFLFFLITLAPFLLLIIQTFFINQKLEKKIIKQYFAAFLIGLLLISFCAWKSYEKVFLFKFEILKKKYSFLRLCLGAYFFWSALTFVSLINGFATIFLLTICAIFSDTFSFAIGSLFGRKKISKFSPNKTWEGLIVGNYLALCVMCSLIWFLNINLSIYNVDISSWFSIAIIFFVLIFSSIGDLFFSKQKRIFETKNFSNLLGEHGGFWDRFDSHTFVLGFWLTANLITSLFFL